MRGITPLIFYCKIGTNTLITSCMIVLNSLVMLKRGDYMANLKGKMRKLQTALVKTGIIVKINQNQFYSSDQKRMITSYRIITQVECYNEKKNEWKTKDYEVLSSCSVVDIINCLIEIYRAVSG